MNKTCLNSLLVRLHRFETKVGIDLFNIITVHLIFVITFCELLRTIYTKNGQRNILPNIINIYIEIISGSAISANAFATNNDYEQNMSELIVSAPTPI